MAEASLTNLLGLVIVISPLALVALLGLAALLGRPLPERWTSRAVQASILVSLAAALTLLGWMLATGARRVPIHVGHWIQMPGYHFSIQFLYDRLSVPFVVMTLVLCGTIGAFATRYLHREPGYHRFFFFYAVFVAGMTISTMAGTIETLFAGWEMVGVSSALLVSFFQERPGPVRNGFRVWSVYRVSDAALLLAAVVLHHMKGEGDFLALLGSTPWPGGQCPLTPSQALIVGSLFLIAAAGKSALIPFSGWLPRAMEGPTPSSAVFYGALSVHLGAFLLLRIGPVLDRSSWLSGAVVVLGLATALLATLAARVQSDVKSALSFASLTQVAIIVTEIGLGFRYLPLIHILGHAGLRTMQFLRAPSLLGDHRMMEDAIGARLPSRRGALHGPATQLWLYRFALERGYLDAMLDAYVSRPIRRLFEACDGWERRFTTALSGDDRQRESDRLSPLAGSLEELA